MVGPSVLLAAAAAACALVPSAAFLVRPCAPLAQPMCQPSSSTTRVPARTLALHMSDDSSGDATGVKRVRRRRKDGASPVAGGAQQQEDVVVVSSLEAVVEAAAAPREVQVDAVERAKTAGTKVNMDELGADIAKYRRREEVSTKSAAEGGGQAIKDAFGWILTADFFVVLGFLGYFVVAVAARSAFGNGSLLDKFSELWGPVIQPALGVLMLGTIASGTVSQLSRPEDDQ